MYIMISRIENLYRSFWPKFHVCYPFNENAQVAYTPLYHPSSPPLLLKYLLYSVLVACVDDTLQTVWYGTFTHGALRQTV